MYGKKKNGGEKEAHQFFIITRIHILTYCLNRGLTQGTVSESIHKVGVVEPVA